MSYKIHHHYYHHVFIIIMRLGLRLSNLSWKLPSPHFVSRGQSFNLIAASNFGSCFQGNSLFQTVAQLTLQSSFNCIDKSEFSQARCFTRDQSHYGQWPWWADGLCTVCASQGSVYLWHNNCTEGQSVGTQERPDRRPSFCLSLPLLYARPLLLLFPAASRLYICAPVTFIWVNAIPFQSCPLSALSTPKLN